MDSVVSPLRKARQKQNLTLESVVKKMAYCNVQISPSQLSLIERGTVWPSRTMVDGLIEVFPELTPMDVLYPNAEMGKINHQRTMEISHEVA